MDLQQLTTMLLSTDSVRGIAQRSGATDKDVTKVLTQALPALLGGVSGQAKTADTAQGFNRALSDHAKADTSDLAGFLEGIDLADGAKIIGHLLGGEKDSTTRSVAKKAGVSQKKTASILSSVAPLLMSLLGQQTKGESGDSPIGDLIGTLLDQVDLGELLIGLLTDDSGSKKKKSTKKKSSKKKKSSDAGELLGDLLGGVVKGLFK